MNIAFICLSENSQKLLWITFIKKHHSQIYLSINIFLIMTCDFESVKSWSIHLFKSTASRWVFMLFSDALAEVKQVKTSWNIKNKKQLHQWTCEQLNKIIKMLNELRDQWDMTLKCIKQWIILQVKHISRLNELEINQNTIETQEETITKL